MRITPIVAALAATTLLVPAAWAKDTIVVISPFGTPEAKMAEMRAITTHFLKTVDPDEEAFVIDGLTQEQVAYYALPDDGKDYSSTKRRMRAVPSFFRDTKAFADAAQPASSPYHAGQINLAATLRTIARDYRLGSAQDLIFFAVSPITHDPRSEDFSMRGGAISNDAGIAASRFDWPYGAAEEAGRLSEITVHWGMNGDAWALNDRHAFAMEAYLANTFSVRGATLATLAPNPEDAVRSAARGLNDPIGLFAFTPDRPPMMMHYQPVVALPQALEDVPIYERTISDRVPSRAEIHQAQNVEIAISWDCACDFDIVVRPKNGEPISFRNTRTDAGTLFKDYTSAGDLNNGWETVQLGGPVDLSQALVAVNLYHAARPPSEVELRVAIDGETWSEVLTISGPADRGAGFADVIRSGAPANRAWTVTTAGKVMGALQ